MKFQNGPPYYMVYLCLLSTMPKTLGGGILFFWQVFYQILDGRIASYERYESYDVPDFVYANLEGLLSKLNQDFSFGSLIMGDHHDRSSSEENASFLSFSFLMHYV